jgi:hypothetical protein
MGGKTMKFLGKMWTMLIALVMVAMMCLSAYAATVENVVVWVGGKGDWQESHAVARIPNSQPAGANCSSVYPEWGPDFFGQINCRVVDRTGQRISTASFVPLNETWTGFSQVDLMQGHLNDTTIYFQFCGNDVNLTAYAVVSYQGNYTG